MRTLPHTASCFVCGEANPLGLKLRFETDGKIVHTHFTPRREHVGFRNVIHGGIIATVLDEIMVWACVIQTRRFAYCAELNVRYQNPLHPGETVIATAELAANRRNKIFEAKGELRGDDGKLFASATGKYLPLRQEEASGMLGDFVGDATGLLDGVE